VRPGGSAAACASNTVGCDGVELDDQPDPSKASTFPPPGRSHVSADGPRAQVSRTKRHSALASARDSHFVASHHGRCSWPGHLASRRCFQTLRERRSPQLPSRWHPSRCHGMPGRGNRRSRLMSRGSGSSQRPVTRQRPGSDCCAGVAPLLLNARSHPSKPQQEPQCPARRRQHREHRLCHGLPGTTGTGNAIVTERGHITRSQPETSGA
jgi:hypothetical protein